MALETQQSSAKTEICDFFFWDNDVLVLNILGTPSAKQNKIGKIKGNQLKVSVTCAPENGKATLFMVKFLAKEFGVKNSAIEVVYGMTSIHKQLRIKQAKKIPAAILNHSSQNQRHLLTMKSF